ncbi:hypothetical protein NDU88_003107 [Pleurodeles waltl]|uniref:Uncharacterized protein n=1 Tax=Pleurodeles waltl TaxID=8319 RepID=A0AAV7NIF0_PLEWA|nr:hypothetical protein NDU88_003107 [Pleurodeles waltl]
MRTAGLTAARKRDTAVVCSITDKPGIFGEEHAQEKPSIEEVEAFSIDESSSSDLEVDLEMQKIPLPHAAALSWCLLRPSRVPRLRGGAVRQETWPFPGGPRQRRKQAPATVAGAASRARHRREGGPRPDLSSSRR